MGFLVSTVGKYWGGRPFVVDCCISSLNANAQNHPVIELSKSNYENYITIPPTIKKKFEMGMISITAYSDIIRVLLLSKYGGAWVDATVFINSWIKEDLSNISFFSIRRDSIRSKKYVSENKWSSFFLISSKNNFLMQFLGKCFVLYWEKYDCQIDYFLLDYLIKLAYEEIPKLREMIDAIPASNQNIDWLAKHLDDEYNPRIYAAICKDTDLFKLNWRMELVYTNKTTYQNKILGRNK